MALPKLQVQITADTKQAEAGFDRVQNELRQTGEAADNAAKRTDAMGATLNRTAGRSSAFGRNLQNASFQVADFATQVGSGTSASIALGQQLPQLLGGFGILGAALGAVVAVAVPLTRAFQGMSDQGRDMSVVLGVLSPLANQLATAFQTVADVGIQMAEVIINNLDRILITAGLVAGFFATKWVAAFVAARVATFSLAAMLGVLRAAMIRTGILALVVGAGELVYQFTRLVNAAGNFSIAMGLLKDVAIESWGIIKRGASLLGEMIGGVAMMVQGAFLGAFAKIIAAFSSLTQAIASGMNALFGTNIQGIGSNLAADLQSQSDYMTTGGAEIANSAGRSLSGLLDEGLPSLQKIKDLLASIKDEKITLPDLLGVGTDDDGGAGSGGKKKTPLEEQTEAQIASLQALRDQGRETWSALGGFLQQFAGKSKAAAVAAIAIQKGLSIAQIIANTAAAQMRALAELGPIAGPPVAAKMGMYGKLQAGLVAATGLSQAMGGGGGGGSGGGGGGAGVTQPAAPAAPTQTVSINLQGDTFSRGSVEGLLEQIQSQLDRGGRLVFA